MKSPFVMFYEKRMIIIIIIILIILNLNLDTFFQEFSGASPD